MLKFLLYIMLFSYACNIFVNLFRLFQILKGIRKLNSFINAYDFHRDCNRKQKALLRYFPIISKYLGVHSGNLPYGESPFHTHYRAVPMRNALLSKRDCQMHCLIESFNPLFAIRTIFVFPSNFLFWCGFRPSTAQKSIANMLGIAVEVLLAKAIEVHYADFETFIMSIWDIFCNML